MDCIVKVGFSFLKNGKNKEQIMALIIKMETVVNVSM